MSNDKSLNNVNNAEMIFSPKVMVQNFVPTIADKTQYLFNAVHSNEDIKFNGENFSLVHLNGNHLASNSKNNNKMNFAGGHVRVLAINKEEKKENIRCLCSKCLKDYIHNPDYIVRRLDPFAKVKDHCDKCNQSGWDYVIAERQHNAREKGCQNV